MIPEEAMTITEFLLARITEDEVKATLRTVHAEDCGWIPNEAGYSYPCNCGVPERMAAECAAKRAIIGLHGRNADIYGEAMGDTCTMCTETGPDAQGWPCDTLRALAAVYAGHPDYQQEWGV